MAIGGHAHSEEHRGPRQHVLSDSLLGYLHASIYFCCGCTDLCPVALLEPSQGLHTALAVNMSRQHV